MCMPCLKKWKEKQKYHAGILVRNAEIYRCVKLGASIASEARRVGRSYNLVREMVKEKDFDIYWDCVHGKSGRMLAQRLGLPYDGLVKQNEKCALYMRNEVLKKEDL